MASYQNIQLALTPKQAFVESELKEQIAKKIHVKADRIRTIQIIKKSTDARKRNDIKINLTLNVYTDNTQPEKIEHSFHYQDVQDKKPVIIVGAGPAGMFGALRLIELGLKPIIIERGKMVSDRKKDIALLNRREGLNTESNYCFGEGGAGTFSDGKLFTRSKKKGDCSRILDIFHMHGAQDSILYPRV